jgi:hypothetical protein
VVRTKTTELAVTGENRFHLIARLTDMSYDCAYGSPADHGVIHDFTVESDLEGEDLVITDLHVAALAHPYGGCPAIVPRCQELTGHSLVSGWRRTVLETWAGRPGAPT